MRAFAFALFFFVSSLSLAGVFDPVQKTVPLIEAVEGLPRAIPRELAETTLFALLSGRSSVESGAHRLDRSAMEEVLRSSFKEFLIPNAVEHDGAGAFLRRLRAETKMGEMIAVFDEMNAREKLKPGMRLHADILFAYLAIAARFYERGDEAALEIVLEPLREQQTWAANEVFYTNPWMRSKRKDQLGANTALAILAGLPTRDPVAFLDRVLPMLGESSADAKAQRKNLKAWVNDLKRVGIGRMSVEVDRFKWSGVGHWAVGGAAVGEVLGPLVVFALGFTLDLPIEIVSAGLDHPEVLAGASAVAYGKLRMRWNTNKARGIRRHYERLAEAVREGERARCAAVLSGVGS